MAIAATLPFEQAAGRIWDVLVVGAGPAGAFAAHEIARQNASVLLVDKAAFPRYKVCGGCLNAAALATLQAAGLGSLPIQLGGKPFHALRLAVGSQFASIPLPAGVAVSREAFDTALIEQAIFSGADFLPLTTAVLDSVSDQSRRAVLYHSLKPMPVQARVVLVADGLGGGLLKSEAGFTKVAAKHSRVGVGTIANAAPDFYEAGSIFMACARGGYVGIVQIENSQLEIAAAFDPEFLRRAGGSGKAAELVIKQAGFPCVDGLAAMAWRGTPALTHTQSRLAVTRLFVLGDAAGYVEPFTGEGMAWALASAAAVTSFAIEAAQNWAPSLADQWTQCHRALLGSRQKACKRVTRLLRQPLLMRAAVGALSKAPSLAAPLVKYLNAELAYAGSSS